MKKLHRFDEALADYIQATQLDPDYTLALCNAGYLHGNRAEFREALNYLERAMALGDIAAARATSYARRRLGLEISRGFRAASLANSKLL